jgi:hypothetical protein
VKYVLQTSPFWAFIFLVIAVLGGAAQYQSSKRSVIASYNRMDEISGPA